MGDNHNQDSMHWVMGGALLLIGAFVAIVLVMLNSQADNVNTSANVNNVAPTVVDVYMTTGADFTQSDNTGGNGGAIDLVANGIKTVKVTGTVEDLNGAADIQTVSLAFYNSAQAPSCSVDSNNCYKVNNCQTQAGPTLDQLDFNCTVNLAHWTDSSVAGGPDATKEWVVSVDVKDVDNVTTNNNALRKEVNTLLALQIPNALDFGTLALLSQTNAGNNQTMTVTQFGNDEADVEVSMATPMNCSVRGSIPQNAVKWGLTDAAWNDVGNVALSGTPTDTELNVGYRTNDGVALTKDLFWNISIPSGVEGTCNSNMVITAIAR